MDAMATQNNPASPAQRDHRFPATIALASDSPSKARQAPLKRAGRPGPARKLTPSQGARTPKTIAEKTIPKGIDS
jgi:hypothetical protein